MALVLGVLASMWPSSLTPIEGGTHTRVVIDTPAGEVTFALRKDAAKRMWHVPEVSERKPDQDAARLRDQRLMQLAGGIVPQAPHPLAAPPTHLRVTDRRNGRDSRGD
ncbi:hypothetical protein [Streptomyces violaceusniger]|uniref:Uncharacterized protein n=1 Tax=Streptomyces violaceusniger (strain Tu 4113) TaxID=653045 RepID=G2PHG8_STRV4|nr:hypothetical protein [Streptomyces violaceusniger]AEM88814.1 hypothetical protein Strvi_0037 [Streptomyces violaceusniger Tu 4113]